MSMRIVLDINVIVSALITRGGQPDRLLDAVKRGDCTLITSAYQIEELKEVLGRDRRTSVAIISLWKVRCL